MNKVGNSELRSFPDSRVSTIDVFKLGLSKHHVKALLEVDVTNAKEIFKGIKERDGASLSFTAWLVKCVSTAVGEYREANAFLRSSKTMLIFNDIDICITVEKEYNGQNVPLPYVIRNTNSKSILDIHNEIRQAQKANTGDGNVVIGQDYGKLGTKLFLSLPGVIRRLVWRSFLLKPYTAKKNMGSVMITSVGMYSSFDGWVIPTSIHPLCFAIGTITKKPGVVDGNIAVRDYLKMTALIDHDVIDGAPAARFLSRLDELLKTAYGLDKEMIHVNKVLNS
ncbi:MAG TPA: 2-oxo acid dehydrogenase subunit E2 [Syntrophomonadaceae bacterium]|nr:2-oxo acid dehydrogenase subunit E2 [Syntrophomonadaceae bacterium]